MKKNELNITFKSNSLNGSTVKSTEILQELWSGYGSIKRIYLDNNTCYNSIIAKHINADSLKSHPRGWSNDFSHQRKLSSYQIELEFFENWAMLCQDECKVPKLIEVQKQSKSNFIIYMEDMNEIGFPSTFQEITWEQAKACIKWLANFHATFLNKEPKGLWETGTYWHLNTRPNELKSMPESSLKKNAAFIDRKLSSGKYKTFVHGDAKLANFCFSQNGDKAGAVDFQYVGGGCGMKDLAYFIGSCMNEKECFQYEKDVLDFYFNELQKALTVLDIRFNFSELESEWRQLYPFAWADFERFLLGWSPNHWKLNQYSQIMTNKALDIVH
ncbi:oxidoreductase family protein [Aureibacter tunicatorum]|uniref:CHK kinase-like domain-containing protein n=1 Tax=Aureibacter tunicatorum TaxID=866807 RepID=A0AAE3XLT4_9BACT|nr:oxidoreductase family protein [Aureibacter tunicatorum]MDR6239267.1 hypothetical protein [Aureibacter tunicatorum]BDD04808.1 phosphotransferase [Aureibacter tunicatorum]